MTAAPSPPVDLSIGDPGYEPPREVQAVAVQAIAKGLGGYAPPGGLRRLRSALAARLRDRDRIPASPDEVVVTSGASLGIFATLGTRCRPGDLVLLPDPGFPLYRLAADTLGLRVAGYPLTGPEPGEPDWPALAELAPGARLLIWNYPSNPLGALARPAWFARLFALLDRFPELVLLSDEVYQDLCLEPGHAGPAAAAAGDLADRVVSVFSFSKSFGMAAWRLGYVHARAGWAAQIARAHWGATMSTATVSQLAGRAALRVPESYLDERRAFLRANRDLAVARLSGCGLPCRPPPGGFFVWVDIGQYGMDGETFAERCAEEAGVLISAGGDFGPSGRERVRINYAVPEERLRVALDRLQAWMHSRLSPVAGG
jgi:aspartate aminotransferase